MSKTSCRIVVLTSMLVTIGLCTGQQVAHAQASITYTVDTQLDLIDADTADGICPVGLCSLRAAIMQANVMTGPGVRIIVPSGTYTLTRPPLGANGPEQGDLNLATPMIGSDTPISIEGAGAGSTVVDANYIDRVFRVHEYRQASISGLTIRHGLPSGGDGGGIYINGGLTLTQVTVTANQANWGGGVANDRGSLIVMRSTFTANRSFLGGAVYSYAGFLRVVQSTMSGNLAESGGGIYTAHQDGTSEVIQSTISSNQVIRDGGGIINESGGILHVINSTISQNTADKSGGGIANTGILNIYNSSVVFNVADADAMNGGAGGGIANDSVGTFNLRHTLVAANRATGPQGGFDDCVGLLYAYGWNLFWVLTGCNVETTNGNVGTLSSLADIGPLRDNGGPTLTHALRAGSNAIDRGGDAAVCADNNSVPLATDQRGFPRLVDGDLDGTANCDIGAHEFAPSGFTDDPLIAGASVIRAIHITQLQGRIDAQRTRFGLSPFGWTPVAAGTTLMAVHVSELRTALQQAYIAAGKLAPTFTDSQLAPQTTFVRAVHIVELRDAAQTLESS